MEKHQRIYFRLNRVQHHIRKVADRLVMDKAGISSAQVGAMFLIQQQSGCLQSEIAAELGLDESGVTTMMRRMERGGVIERRVDPNDRRARRVYLTELGNEKLGQVAEMLVLFNKRLSEGFSEQELDTIVRFLSHLQDVRTEDFTFGKDAN